MTLYVNNPACIELKELIACGDTDIIIDANVQAVMTDPDGNEVVGQVWPLAMPYDSADQVYRAITADEIELTDCVIYTTKITASKGGNVIGEWEVREKAKYRRLS